MEVSLSDQARKLRYKDLWEKYGTACAIIPRKASKEGMKVRIDGVHGHRRCN